MRCLRCDKFPSLSGNELCSECQKKTSTPSLTFPADQDYRCAYIYDGIQCCLTGTVKKNGSKGWYCNYHYGHVREGVEKQLLEWIVNHRREIYRALKDPLYHDFPFPDFVNYPRNREQPDDLPF